MKLFATKLFTLLFCCFFLAGQVNAQNLEVREEWRAGWFNNQVNMEYFNAPTGTNNPPGDGSATHPGTSSPGYFPTNPECAPSVTWALSQATAASSFFVISTQGNPNDRYLAAGAGARPFANDAIVPVTLEVGNGADANQLTGAIAAGQFVMTKLDIASLEAIVMVTDNQPVRFAHVSGIDQMVLGSLTEVPSPGENVFIRYRTRSAAGCNVPGAWVIDQATIGGVGGTVCPGAACFSYLLPTLEEYEFYVLTSTASLADVTANPELCTLYDYGDDLNGQRALDAGASTTGCAIMYNFLTRVDEPVVCVPENGATIVMDGSRDGDYRHVIEGTHAAPLIPLCDDASAQANSDFIGESAAFTIYRDGAFDYNNWANIGGNGTADIQRFDISWDKKYLYLIVEGPGAYFVDENGGVDEMDLFIAIDTDDATSADPYTMGVNLPAASGPWNKRVDFNGWTPEFFVAVERFQAGNHLAQLVAAGGAMVAEDTDAGAEAADCSFEYRGRFDVRTTEVRVPWAMIGGRPDAISGQIMNFAIYTTGDADNYDVYDTGPGLGEGHGKPFEQIGDTPWDGDHVGGAGHIDPVTGVGDPTFLYDETVNGDPFDSRVRDQGPGDNQNFSMNGRQPASDAAILNGADVGDFDTIEEYYQVGNVGQVTYDYAVIFPAGATIACDAADPTAAAFACAPITVGTDMEVVAGFTITLTDEGSCYDPEVEIVLDSEMETGTAFNAECAAACAGETTELTRNYIVTFKNKLQALTGDCPEMTMMDEDVTGMQIITRTPVDGTGACLPVELIGFEANYDKETETVLLLWETASEVNNSHFEIEHSIDAKSWTAIGKIQGSGTTVQAQQYQFIDENYLKGTNYYRLKQVDFDSAYEYSNIRSVTISTGKDWSFFPNPVDNKLTIRTAIEGEFLISVYDSKGALAKSIVASIDGNTVELDLAALSNGLYFVNVYSVDGQGVISQQILKQ